MVYSKNRPAKRKRATLESDPPRDTRMGWRRLSVRQGSHRAPLSTYKPVKDNQSFPPMPCKLRGFGGAELTRLKPRACMLFLSTQGEAVHAGQRQPAADIIAEQLADIIAEQQQVFPEKS